MLVKFSMSVKWVRTVSLLAVTLMCAWVGQAHAQLTTNVLLRVRMIRPAGSSSFGTGFTLDVDGRQYLITAKHVVAGMKENDTLDIRSGDQWSPLAVRVLRCSDPIDVAVLVPPRQLTVTFPFEPTMNGMRYAQDVFFAGFPYGLSTKAQELTKGFALPFVRKAIVSATMDNSSVIFLDGHNNPGFSGGPIVFRDLDRSDVVYKLAGVVSGFESERSPVLIPKEIAPEKITADDIAEQRIFKKDGHVFRLDDTGELVNSNTGIVIGYNIGHALDLIAKNPIGPKVSETFKE
jgi:S1-C subfamily serine protease